MKKVLAAVVSFIVLGTTSVFAEPAAKHTFELAPEISYIKYEEPGVMKEKGVMYGINGSYTYHNNIMLKAEGRYTSGKVDYDGSGTINNVDDYMWEFRGLGGYDFLASETSVLTPYIGIGYRYLNDDSSAMISSTGALGYEREISYLYAPVGVELLTKLQNNWSVGAKLEYDFFLDGTVKSHLGAIPGYYDIEMDQDDGYGIRAAVRLGRKIGTINLAIEPFIRYWNIKQSKITTAPDGISWLEPKNKSTEFGLMVAVVF